MPSNPLLAAYVLGAYGWAALLLFAVVVRPLAFGAALHSAERAGVSRAVALAVLVVLYTVAWPITVLIILATGRRG
jgi:hypothetical protein